MEHLLYEDEIMKWIEEGKKELKKMREARREANKKPMTSRSCLGGAIAFLCLAILEVILTLTGINSGGYTRKFTAVDCMWTFSFLSLSLYWFVRFFFARRHPEKKFSYTYIAITALVVMMCDVAIIIFY